MRKHTVNEQQTLSNRRTDLEHYRKPPKEHALVATSTITEHYCCIPTCLIARSASLNTATIDRRVRVLATIERGGGDPNFIVPMVEELSFDSIFAAGAVDPPAHFFTRMLLSALYFVRFCVV